MNEIQDIQNEQNEDPKIKVKKYNTNLSVKLYNYPLDQLTTKLSSCLTEGESIMRVTAKYEYLSGDAFHIGKLVNDIISKHAVKELTIKLPNILFKLQTDRSFFDFSIIEGELTIKSEFTPRALEPIVGTLLKNINFHVFKIMFGSYKQFIQPAKYIYNTFEEYFSTPKSFTRPDKDQKYNAFYLSNYVLKTMNEKLYGAQNTHFHNIQLRNY